MPLTSLTFIFVFLPVFLFLFYVLPFSNWRNGILVLGSLIFFGWADLTHLPLLVLVILFNYGFGLIIGSLKGYKHTAGRFMMWVAVLANLFGLIFYKYAGFIVQSLADFANLTIEFEQRGLPLGISFFTFSAIAYVVDVYHGSESAQKNPIRFSSYLIMFPKLLQGPITRLGQVKNELNNPKFVPNEMIAGARRFIGGLAKKILLADSLALITDKVFSLDFNQIGVDLAWFGLISYTLQIYLDFSGYTDMAIGLGKMIGFKLPENFNFPYISRSITDFWRRWHMTLTAWFRTYLFIPLEFARKREKLLRQQTNILIVFLLTGLWHGASWNFVIWGVYFGLILAIEASGFGRFLKKLPVVFQYTYSLALVMLGWVFFRIPVVSNWKPFLSALVGGNGLTADVSIRSLGMIYYIPYPLMAVLFCVPLFFRIEKKIDQVSPVGRLVMDLLYLALFVLSISSILAKGFNAFIYAQF